MSSDSELEAALTKIQESIDVCFTSDIKEDEKGDTTGLTVDLTKGFTMGLTPNDLAIGAIKPLGHNTLRSLNYVKYEKDRGPMWPVGETLRVRFMISPAFAAPIGRAVLAIAKEWETHANIEFKLVDAEPSDIRVSMNVGAGSRSAVGIMAKDPDRRGQPTMNLDILGQSVTAEVARRTILHEFGHVLGLMHEHQRSDSGISYNKAKVYKHYGKGQEARADHNVLTQLTPVHKTLLFDPNSIMLYQVRAELTTNKIGYARPLVLSDMDKEFIGLMYPNFD